MPETDVIEMTDVREMTVVSTSSGEIHVIHEITLGDVIISTVLLAFMTFVVLSRFIGRDK